MLKNMRRNWLSALAILVSPMLAQADGPAELFFQDQPAAAPAEEAQEQPKADEAAPAPAPPEDGAAEKASAPPAAPAEADGVAHVGKCGAGCGPAGCRSGSGSNCRAGGCRSGACASGAVPGVACGNCRGNGCSACGNRGVIGGCHPGCSSHAGGPCNCGMVNALCNDPFACGRPYTIGDLKCDLHHWKCNVKHEMFGNSCDSGCVDSWLANEVMKYKCRRRYRNAILAAHIHNKLNYFIPSGGDGRGIAPFGTYSRVYAVQPDYFDPRDGQVFAAPSTGVPTVIPIAPNVRHQYNYSWGIPSSRITPLYNVMQPSRK